MTELIFKLSSLIGRLSVQNMTAAERESILREIHSLIENYFQGLDKKVVDFLDTKDTRNTI